MPALLIACGGFLLGVLWMDLLFDVQILGGASEAAVASIATYYRHATIEAYPMNRLIAAVMMVTVIGALYELARGRTARRIAAPALLLAIVPIGVALMRVVPNAVRLGTQADALAEQVALARKICVDHLLCLALVAAFIVLQIVVVSRRTT